MYRTDIAVITIIPEEYRAASSILTDPQFVQDSNEVNDYAWVSGSVGAYSVVVGLVGKAGTTPCALAVTAAAQRFSPRSLVVLGIAGGRSIGKQKLRIGDIVISEKIWYYEYGKIDTGFAPRTHYTYTPDSALYRNALVAAESNVIWADNDRNDHPTIHHGTIASGDKVIDNTGDEYFQRVIKANPKIIAIEMEGAGAGEAIHELSRSNTPISMIMLRGISDIPPTDPSGQQTEQRDNSKEYACSSVALFLKHWIENRWPYKALSKKEAEANLTATAIRKRLSIALPVDDLLDQFCIDHFPTVAAMFTSGMTQLRKQNLLIQMVPLDEIAEALVDFGRP